MLHPQFKHLQYIKIWDKKNGGRKILCGVL